MKRKGPNNAKTKLAEKERKANKDLVNLINATPGQQWQRQNDPSQRWMFALAKQSKNKLRMLREAEASEEPNLEIRARIITNKTLRYAYLKQKRAETAQVKAELMNEMENGDVAPANAAKSGVEGLIGDMEQPRPTPRQSDIVVRALQARIRELEPRIRMEEKYPPAEDPGDWDRFKGAEIGKDMNRMQKRALWRDRRDNATILQKLGDRVREGKEETPKAFMKKKELFEIEHERNLLKLKDHLSKLKAHLALHENQDDARHAKLGELEIARQRLQRLKDEKEGKIREYHATLPLREELPPTIPRSSPRPLLTADDSGLSALERMLRGPRLDLPKPAVPRLSPRPLLTPANTQLKPLQSFLSPRPLLNSANTQLGPRQSPLSFRPLSTPLNTAGGSNVVMASSTDGPQEAPSAGVDQLRAQRDELLARQAKREAELRRTQEDQPKAEEQRAPSEQVVPEAKTSNQPADQAKQAQMQEIVQSINFLKTFSSNYATPDTAAAAMADKATSLLEELQQQIVQSETKPPPSQPAPSASSEQSPFERPFLIRFTNDTRTVDGAAQDPPYSGTRSLLVDPKSPLIKSLNHTAEIARHELQREEHLKEASSTAVPAGDGSTENTAPQTPFEIRLTNDFRSASEVAQDRTYREKVYPAPSDTKPTACTNKFQFPLKPMKKGEETPSQPVVFGESHKPAPLRPQWPSPKRFNFTERLGSSSRDPPAHAMVDLPTERYEKPAPELPPVAEQTPAFLGPELTPLVFSEAKHIQTTDLRSNLPIEGSQVIDNELHINFDAAVPDLQSQLYNLQYRLQNAYPRIDTLPYDVWTSTNKKTLKMWLKILAGKWETRFENIEYNVDDDLATVLDQMVQEHELSNEAARRMAQKFDMVFAKRGSMHGDSEGTLNLDEFEAEWGSWLRDDHAEDASDQVGEGSAVGVEAEGSEGGELKSGNANTNTNAGKPSHGLLGSLPFSWSAKPETGYRRADSPVRHFSTSALSRSAPKKEDTLPVAHSKAQNSPSTSPSASLSALPHLTPTGSAHMVSVSRKPSTLRTAIAIGRVRFSNATPLSLIKSNALKKGDVLSVARIAGITAAKKTPDLVPLCHPIMLEHVGVSVTVMNPQEGNGVFDFGGIHIQAKVQCTGPTGVEMEALSAVMGAALTVVDMCKAVDRGMGIEGVRVVLKEGGRSGTWREEGWEEKAIED